MRQYREIYCAECGKKVIDKSIRQNQKYCGDTCNKRAYLRRKGMLKETEFPCKYNDGVVCDARSCYGCGWHPDEEKKRKELLLG